MEQELIHCWKNKLTFSYKINIVLLYNPAPALRVYPKKLQIYIHKKTCTGMLLEALFLIVKTWKLPRHSSVGEWIKKRWYIQKMEPFSALKMLLDSEKIWKILNSKMLLTDKSQSAKVKRVVIAIVWHSRKTKLKK